VLTACKRAKTEFQSVFETSQWQSIFELVRSGFGFSLVPEMAASGATGCVLVELETHSFRRIGYLRTRRQFVSKPMHNLSPGFVPFRSPATQFRLLRDCGPPSPAERSARGEERELLDLRPLNL
jgi:DNA-binding transcriptional LysR family regulator